MPITVKDIKWLKCPECQEEYSKLTSFGICMDCFLKKQEKETRNKMTMYKVTHKTKKEIAEEIIKKYKRRADIDD